ELDALIAAVAAGILGSPIVWLHYAVILMVVLAAKWPRLSPIWALPMLFWLTPRETGEGTAALLFGVAVFLVLSAAGIGWRPGRNIPSARRPRARPLRSAGSRRPRAAGFRSGPAGRRSAPPRCGSQR